MARSRSLAGRVGLKSNRGGWRRSLTDGDPLYSPPTRDEGHHDTRRGPLGSSCVDTRGCPRPPPSSIQRSSPALDVESFRPLNPVLRPETTGRFPLRTSSTSLIHFVPSNNLSWHTRSGIPSTRNRPAPETRSCSGPRPIRPDDAPPRTTPLRTGARRRVRVPRSMRSEVRTGHPEVGHGSETRRGPGPRRKTC